MMTSAAARREHRCLFWHGATCSLATASGWACTCHTLAVTVCMVESDSASWRQLNQSVRGCWFLGEKRARDIPAGMAARAVSQLPGACTVTVAAARSTPDRRGACGLEPGSESGPVGSATQSAATLKALAGKVLRGWDVLVGAPDTLARQWAIHMVYWATGPRWRHSLRKGRAQLTPPAPSGLQDLDAACVPGAGERAAREPARR